MQAKFISKQFARILSSGGLSDTAIVNIFANIFIRKILLTIFKRSLERLYSYRYLEGLKSKVFPYSIYSNSYINELLGVFECGCSYQESF